MKVSGKKSFTISQLEKFEMLVLRTALNNYYKLELNESAEGGISFQGETALRLLNQLNDYCNGLG
jgi:hypothetical protein